MSDIITQIGKSRIQHGMENNRIYLMKFHTDDRNNIIEELDKIIKKHEYTKVFAKIPSSEKKIFLDKDYIVEASVPNFYKGIEDAYFMAKYYCVNRKKQKNEEKISKVLKLAQSKHENQSITPLNNVFQFRKTELSDANEMAKVYKTVFESYPFPIEDPKYIRKTMEENIVYFGVWHKEKLVALSSCEMDVDELNVEMTDFAVLPEYRGNKFAIYLLDRMEYAMKKRGIKTAYTIARSVSYGMNSTFARQGYKYTGTLIQNTNIAGDLESMNVWYKTL